MPYHMDYSKKDDTHPLGFRMRRFALTVCMFLLFLFLTDTYWPEGTGLLKKLLLPPKTLHAAEVFVQELNCGYSVVDAAGNFLMTMDTYENPD